MVCSIAVIWTCSLGNIGEDAVGPLAALDLQGNGVVDRGDAGLYISFIVQTSNGQTGTFAGDLNCDGQVDILSDAFALIAHLGDDTTRYSDGDIDFDGDRHDFRRRVCADCKSGQIQRVANG